MQLKSILIAFLAIPFWGISALAAELTPDCSGAERWPAAMVGVYLKSLGLSSQAGGYEKIEVERLASELLQIPDIDRIIFRQVHKVVIHDQGNIFTAITRNDVSQQECSESGVEVYFITIECGTDSKNCQDVGTIFRK